MLKFYLNLANELSNCLKFIASKMAKTYRPKLSRSASRAYGSGTIAGGTGSVTSWTGSSPGNLKISFKGLAILVIAVFVTNIATHSLFNPAMGAATDGRASISSSAPYNSDGPSLYLMDEASLFVHQPDAFEKKVREISRMLNVAPEWLMAVMYSESKFDAGVKNYKGSGATGLIQFMPMTASEMGVSLDRLGRMDHLQQLEYVYMYLQTVRDRYGNFDGLTELYLAILYPKAINQEYCYTLYASPSKKYKQNSGLDENKDARVTVSDIDKRMQRLYPQAYIAKPA